MTLLTRLWRLFDRPFTPSMAYRVGLPLIAAAALATRALLRRSGMRHE